MDNERISLTGLILMRVPPTTSGLKGYNADDVVDIGGSGVNVTLVSTLLLSNSSMLLKYSRAYCSMSLTL